MTAVGTAERREWNGRAIGQLQVQTLAPLGPGPLTTAARLPARLTF